MSKCLPLFLLQDLLYSDCSTDKQCFFYSVKLCMAAVVDFVLAAMGHLWPVGSPLIVMTAC
jgi:hypothetical protein